MCGWGRDWIPVNGRNAKKPIIRICLLNLTLSVKICPGILNVTSFRDAAMSPRKTVEARRQYAKFNVRPLNDGVKMRNLTIADLGESRFICLWLHPSSSWFDVNHVSIQLSDNSIWSTSLRVNSIGEDGEGGVCHFRSPVQLIFWVKAVV